MPFKVQELRAAGLQAKWTKTKTGAPIIIVRDPRSPLRHQRENWWFLNSMMGREMREAGITEGFTRATLLGDVFSV